MPTTSLLGQLQASGWRVPFSGNLRAGIRQPGVYGKEGAGGIWGWSTGRLPASFWGADFLQAGALLGLETPLGLALVQALVGRGSPPHRYLPPHGAQPEHFLQGVNNSLPGKVKDRGPGQRFQEMRGHRGIANFVQMRGTQATEVAASCKGASCFSQGHAQEGLAGAKRLALPLAPQLRPGPRQSHGPSPHHPSQQRAPQETSPPR